MILISTLLKLREKDANVFRLDIPETSLNGAVIPAYVEYFATRAQANKYAASRNEYEANWNHGTIVITVSVIPAKDAPLFS